MERTKRPTLADVAAVAGVSKMTVSRALRGARDVSQESLDKVSQAAKDIGYVGNPLATSLSGKRSDLIGVVVPSLGNVVFAEVLSGIAEGIAGSGMQPVFGVTDYDGETEYDVIRNMLSWNPAGMIVTGLDQPDTTLRLLQNANIPVVQIMDTDGAPIDACVGLSHQDAGAAMAEALVAAGRQRFGYVGCGLERDSRARKRLDGFQAALAGHGRALEAQKTDANLSTVSAGKDLTAAILRDHPDLDCLYYSNDDLAAGGAFHCIAQKIEMPQRLILAGFNGLDFVQSLPVAIATSQTPRRDIGKVAAQIILEQRGRSRLAQGQKTVFTPRITLGV